MLARLLFLIFFFLFLLLTMFLSRPRKITKSIPMSTESWKEVPGHTVWMLWLQGFKKAPYVVKECVESWKRHNPTWNVELVSLDTLHDYISLPPSTLNNHQNGTISDAALSDIIRIHLLFHRGGVWADATLLCMRPLDDYLYDMLQPQGFWMYRGTRGPCSWFIASVRGSPLITTWYHDVVQYWSQRSATSSYFWMDDLFVDRLSHDGDFRKKFESYPVLDCEKESSHCLAGRVGAPLSDDVRRILSEKPPYVLKLSHKDKIGGNSNGYFAIQQSKKMVANFPLHSFLAKKPLPFPHDLVVVISDCGDKEGVRKILKLLQDRSVTATVMVYDKCNFCQHQSLVTSRNNIQWLPLPNVGREQHTWMHFFDEYYEVLPEHILLMSSSVHKHDRFHHLEEILQEYPPRHYCRSEPREDGGAFTLVEYDGSPLEPSSLKPFSTWFEKNIGPWKGSSRPCWNGWASLGKNEALRHPRSFYRNMKDRLASQGNSSEDAHYMERVMGNLFLP